MRVVEAAEVILARNPPRVERVVLRLALKNGANIQAAGETMTISDVLAKIKSATSLKIEYKSGGCVVCYKTGTEVLAESDKMTGRVTGFSQN